MRKPNFCNGNCILFTISLIVVFNFVGCAALNEAQQKRQERIKIVSRLPHNNTPRAFVYFEHFALCSINNVSIETFEAHQKVVNSKSFYGSRALEV